jgi:hypothetical protein
LDPIVAEYNNEKIEGTSYKRRAVRSENFQHFLSQLFKTPDHELLWNSYKAGPFATASWNAKLFKFNLGDRVLVSFRANWKTAHSAFHKVTVAGGYTKQAFTISGRQLRKTKGHKEFVPVYSLLEMGPSLHFYNHELKLAPLRQEQDEEPVPIDYSD